MSAGRSDVQVASPKLGSIRARSGSLVELLGYGLNSTSVPTTITFCEGGGGADNKRKCGLNTTATDLIPGERKRWLNNHVFL